MAGQSNKTKPISVRMPKKELAVIDTYAAGNDLTRAESILHFLRLGIKAETGEAAATKSDLVAFAATLQKAIESQPIALQQNAPALPAPGRKLSLAERITGRAAK